MSAQREIAASMTHDPASARRVRHRGRTERATEAQECGAFLTVAAKATGGVGGDAWEPDAGRWMCYAISERDAVVVYDMLRRSGREH